MSAANASDRWVLVLLAGLVVLASGAFWPSLAGLAELWSHPDRRTYQHGYLIAALSLWVVWRERRRIAGAIGEPSPILLLLAFAGSLAWAIAWNANLQVVHFLLWPAVLWAAAAGTFGVAAGRALLFPVGFLYFALPIWDALTPVLQDATVFANRVLAALVGMPVLIEGTYIHIPEGSFEIAGGCSGLNYLIVGLAISTLLGEVNRDRPLRRVMLIALGGGLAILSNWLRVFTIIFAGHLSDMTHYLVKVDHYNFGWVLFAFVLAGFFLIVRRLPHQPAPTASAAMARPAAVAGPATIVVAATAIGLGPMLTHASGLAAASTADVQVIGPSELDLNRTDAWTASVATGSWVPVFPGADAETLVEFSRGPDRVTAYTATYLRQVQGRELVGHESRVDGRLAGRLGRPTPRRAVDDPPIEVLEAEWRSPGGARALLWWTYQVGERRFTRPIEAQLWYGIASLVKVPVSSVVALQAACGEDCKQARAALGRYAKDALPQLMAVSVQVKP